MVKIHYSTYTQDVIPAEFRLRIQLQAREKQNPFGRMNMDWVVDFEPH